MRRLEKDNFIEEARKVHGDKYVYTKVEYKNNKTKVCIICPEHGEFWQLPTNHLKGSGCPACNGCKHHDTASFVKLANKIHNGRYDYSKVIYKGNKTKVCIICPEHGEFWQTPNSHLNGHGCPECKGVAHKDTERFIGEAKEIHGNKYDYSKVEYINNRTKICIICPEHGEFWQTPSDHLRGKGCDICAHKESAENRTMTKDEFITRANKIHGNKYDYSKVEYINCKTKVCIICPEHGEFWQTPNMHINEGQGCPNCSCNISKDENEIAELLIENGANIERKNREILNGKEIDIFLPNLNIGIEYNGIRWHSEEFNKDKWYHLEKSEEAKKKGVKLIHIFEDEYQNNRTLVEEKLLHMIKKSDKEKIMARKCRISEIDNKTSSVFLNKYHIQGSTKASVYLGCYYDEQLIGVMTFKRDKGNDWELNRFATDYNYNCCGVGGKLFSYFKKNWEYDNIKSFADRRWTMDKDDNLYTKLGFTLGKVLPPDYHYYFDRRRIHKFNFRKKTLSKKYNLPMSMTEEEMTTEIGAYKIWDCGLYKYVYHRV